MIFFFFVLAAHLQDLSSLIGMEPTPPAVEAQSPNQWTAREVPIFFALILKCY